MNYRWLRVPMFGAMALTMTLASTGSAQASPGADGNGDSRSGAAYRQIDYRPGQYDRRVDTRVVYRGGRRVFIRVDYGRRPYHRYYRHRYYERYDPYGRYDRYHRYHRRDRYDRYYR
jgi:hypothetical protein